MRVATIRAGSFSGWSGAKRGGASGQGERRTPCQSETRTETWIRRWPRLRGRCLRRGRGAGHGVALRPGLRHRWARRGTSPDEQPPGGTGRTTDSQGEVPPPGEASQLAAAEAKLLRRASDRGAPPPRDVQCSWRAWNPPPPLPPLPCRLRSRLPLRVFLSHILFGWF